MNKTIIILASIFILTLGHAQTKQGNFIMGGTSNLSFTFNKTKQQSNTQKYEDESTLNISFGPAAGYFVIDNLALGFQLPISYSEYNIATLDFISDPNLFSNKVKITSIVVAPFIRYYFSKTNIKPFLQGTVGLGSSKSKFSNSDTNSSNIFTYGFDGGLAIFLNSNISIDLGAGYGSTTSKPKENNNNLKFINNIFGFNAGINIFI